MIGLLTAMFLVAAEAPTTSGFTGQAVIRIDSKGRCSVARSSGDPAIDRRSCEIALQCVDGKSNMRRSLLKCAPASRSGKSDDAIATPYQIMPAYLAYTACVGGQLTRDFRHNSADLTVAKQANLDAIAACKVVRANQLARALKLQTDHRLFGSRKNAEVAVRRAFDRFDADFVVEPITGKANAQD